MHESSILGPTPYQDIFLLVSSFCTTCLARMNATYVNTLGLAYCWERCGPYSTLYFGTVRVSLGAANRRKYEPYE